MMRLVAVAGNSCLAINARYTCSLWNEVAFQTVHGRRALVRRAGALSC